ncbi:MAG TPA: DNA gyrase subunit A [Candidatus Sumerlaeota bacterium]|nr:DNA gyrase subunit A [Candidatus Sumerlaeota bacterium]
MQELNREQVTPQPIEDEMKTSFIDYAMSVIKGRALPDVRDGLKPVHRRIIFAMNQANYVHNKPYVKSARIVGDTMGKFHPHGDAAIYDSLVRMSQDFSMRAPLIDGQGNFGSIDGDSAAAMRYTEARMSRVCELLLQDIDKDTIDWDPNYDEKELEPSVLPAAIPNLLINGSTGIAVGMATNIPPHNLGETIDAVLVLLENPDASFEDLLRVLPGPDFPTGGYIYGRSGIRDAYKTGRGRLVMRARLATEELRGGRDAIIVTELPYMTNKARLVMEIAEQIRDKRLTGVSEIRDESDRDGMRVVIELKRGENAEVVINQLFKQTQLQSTFGVIMLALVNNRPRYLSLRQILQQFIEHRREVVVRRTRFDLAKAEARMHIVLGLRIAVQNIDDVVAIIRRSESTEAARLKLMEKYQLSEIQANAILDMPLRRLTGLEREKLEAEYNELKRFIEDCQDILRTPARVLKIIGDELRDIKARYADPRRTEIIDSSADLTIEDLIAEQRMIVTITHSGYIKRTPSDLYRSQRRGGKGVQGATAKEEDWVEQLFIGTTHDYMMIFTDQGKAYWLKIYELPQGGRATRGRPIINLLQIEKGENIQAMVPVREFDDNHFLMFVTAQGQIVKNPLSLYSNPRKVGIKAIKLAEGDRLCQVLMSDGQNEIFIGTRQGMAVRFHESEVRPMGRDVAGVRGVTLREGDEVVGMCLGRPGSTLLSVCENGYGKRSAIEDYRLTKRGGIGVINIKTTERNGNVIAILDVIDRDDIMMMTQSGMTVRASLQDIRVIGRATQGVHLINLKENDLLTSAVRIEEDKDENGGGNHNGDDDNVDERLVGPVEDQEDSGEDENNGNGGDDQE